MENQKSDAKDLRYLNFDIVSICQLKIELGDRLA